LHTAENGRPCV